MLRKCLTRALCTLTALAMTGCGKVEKVIEPENKEVGFTQYYTSECTTLNYLTTNMFIDTAVSANVIDCLVDYDEFGNIVPGLAERWSSNEDMTEWTFYIRKGAKWVDSVGAEYAEVKADDWVAAAEYVNNAANASTCQYMYNSGSVVHGAEAYYEYTKYLFDSENGTLLHDKDGHPFIKPEETKPEDIGVRAVDDYTLVYQLDSPCPFFLSILSFPSFMPVNRSYLEKHADMFGRDNKNLLYNGAYLLSSWSPMEKRVMTKNASYWDADKVYIDTVTELYNPDAYQVQADMYLKGEVDQAQLNPEELGKWLDDENRKDLVHPVRMNNSYSYFYCFNFDPEFDSWFEPENWRLAVNNENFRKAVAASLDKLALVSVYDPYDPDRLVSGTVTPKDFTFDGGRDYVMQDQLSAFVGVSGPDPNTAKSCAAFARGELGQIGAKFPIKMLVPYNPTVLGWKEESELLETQIEEMLGRDFIDVIVEKGPETNFLSNVRRSGKYAFLKCNWGADYIDPETFTEPFTMNNDFNFWYKGSTETAKVFNRWYQVKREACAVTNDTALRYSKFAEAESILIEHAVAVPVCVECSGGYIVSKLDEFEGEYATCGIAMQRFKLRKLYDTSYSIEESERRYAKWLAKRSGEVSS